ncbi:MAG: hypothetical protein KDK34_08555, partial [Leptospiraceae bacterium]|nr:hypothetical protein [Leptospiraceae bacterium]
MQKVRVINTARQIGMAFGRKYIMPAVIFLLVPTGLMATPIGFDLYGLIRAERWADIQRHFSNRSPVQGYEKFAMARALMADAGRSSSAFTPEVANAFALYLQVSGVNCSRPSSQADLLNCVEGLRPQKDLLVRLSFLRAAEHAEKYSFRSLQNRLYELIDLSESDPLSAVILRERLEYLVQSQQTTAAGELAGQYVDLDGPLLNLWRARALYKVGKTDEAFTYYVRAARGTNAAWILNAIVGDVRKNYTGRFSPASLAQRTSENRELLAFSDRLSSSEIRALKASMTPVHVIDTTNVTRVHRDGIYLIQAGYGRYLKTLAARAYTHLSQSPEILHDWAALLNTKGETGLAIQLIEQFAHTRTQKYTYWQLYLDLLKKAGYRQKYFEEVLGYLSHYPAHYHVADELIQILIGSDPSKIVWADDAYWKRARETLPHQTGSGRFLYWLKRYYIEKDDRQAIQELYNSFYEQAPGSFYAGAFWETNPEKRDFVSDWRQVNDRASYLLWVARHGGNVEAIRHLKGRNLQPYMDPEALQLWKDMNTGGVPVDENIVLLFRLGERGLGDEFFDNRYEGHITVRENLARMSEIGRRSGSLDLSVYFTRQLAREMLIPEDPFSMPEGLLKVLYPRPYYQLVSSNARRYNIESDMVYALMRQES